MFPNITWSNTDTGNFDLTNSGRNGSAAGGRALLSFPALSYCKQGSTDYFWGGNGTSARYYVNNSCVPYLTTPELAERGHQSVWLYTYLQQTTFSRLCVDATVVPKYYLPLPSDYPTDTPDSDKDYDYSDPGFVPNCGAATPVSSRNMLAVAPERTNILTIMGTAVTSWGRTRSKMATTVKPRADTVPLSASVTAEQMAPVSFSVNQSVSLEVSKLLALAGVDLDSPNALADGGRGPANGTAWPLFRLTGVTIVAQLTYGNFVENGTIDPFNTDDFLNIELYPASVGSFSSPGPKLSYLGNSYAYHKQKFANETYPYADSLFMVRMPTGVQVQFIGGGLVGRPSIKVLLAQLITVILLSSIAQTLTDLSAGFFIDGFRAQKYMEDLEFRIRMMLRSELADSANADQIAMFQQDTMELYSNRAYTASQQARLRAIEARSSARGPAVGDPPPHAENVVEEEEEVKPLESRGAMLRAQQAAPDPNKPRPDPRAGLAAVLPRVETLVIAGAPVHGQVLTAQGFLRNCRCVRFQWLLSRAGGAWQPVPFATLPSFVPTADDAGCLVACEAVPVTDDGFEGAAKRAKAGPLVTAADMTLRVAALVAAARSPDGATVTDGVTRGGQRAILVIRPLTVALRSPDGADEYGSVPVPDVLVDLDRRDGRMLTVRSPFGGDAAATLIVHLGSPEQRDDVALALRQLSRGAAFVPAIESDAGAVPTDDE